MSAHLRLVWSERIAREAMESSPENPYLGPKVQCSQCTRRVTYTTNINGICSRHPEGNKNLGKAIQWERDHKQASMGAYPDYPDGFVFSPPLYRSGFTLGQTVTVNHPDMGGVEVQGEVVGETPATGLVVVQLPGVDGVVQVPLEMINEARLA